MIGTYDGIGAIGEDHARQQAMSPGAGGNPSGCASHHNHAADVLDRIGGMLESVKFYGQRAEIDIHAELTALQLALNEFQEAVRRIRAFHTGGHGHGHNHGR